MFSTVQDSHKFNMLHVERVCSMHVNNTKNAVPHVDTQWTGVCMSMRFITYSKNDFMNVHTVCTDLSIANTARCCIIT